MTIDAEMKSDQFEKYTHYITERVVAARDEETRRRLVDALASLPDAPADKSWTLQEPT